MAKNKIKKDGTISRQGEGNEKFKSEQELQDKIIGYFKDCATKRKMPTLAGICVFLGIDRTTWQNWRKRYSSLTKEADYTIEDFWVQRLNEMGATGAIFYLKNAFREYYKDRYENDLTSGGKPMFLPPEVIKKYNLDDRAPHGKAS